MEYKELTYVGPNPSNAAERLYYYAESRQYYVVLPYTPYSVQLCICSHRKGHYEADFPVRSGLRYKLDGKIVTTGNNGEIVDEEKREMYENTVLSLYTLKPEFRALRCYEDIGEDQMFETLYDWMQPEHFDLVEVKRKAVAMVLGRWYRKKSAS